MENVPNIVLAVIIFLNTYLKYKITTLKGHTGTLWWYLEALIVVIIVLIMIKSLH